MIDLALLVGAHPALVGNHSTLITDDPARVIEDVAVANIISADIGAADPVPLLRLFNDHHHLFILFGVVLEEEIIIGGYRGVIFLEFIEGGVLFILLLLVVVVVDIARGLVLLKLLCDLFHEHTVLLKHVLEGIHHLLVHALA